MPDTAVIGPLTPLLHDDMEDVRIAAAFSLGQIGSRKCEKPLTEAFVSNDPLSEHQRFNAIVLEAGKCGSLGSLKHIASVTTYKPTDTLLLEGAMPRHLSLRFARFDASRSDATHGFLRRQRVIPVPARVMAAHYLARTKNVAWMACRNANWLPVSCALQTTPISDGAGQRLKSTRKRLSPSRRKPSIQRLAVKCNIINADPPDYDTVRAASRCSCSTPTRISAARQRSFSLRTATRCMIGDITGRHHTRQS